MQTISAVELVKRAGVASLFIAIIGAASGQHSQIKTPASTKGSLSGRVFAITKSGDLKPARMADVYILFGAGLTRESKVIDSGDTAALIYMEEHNHSQEAFIAQIKDSQWTESEECAHNLATFSPAILKTIEWVQTHKKTNQLVKVQADEDGNISPVSLPAGQYLVVVRGRAGLNEGLWDSGFIDLMPGSQIELKLASPETSCLDAPQ